MIEIEGMQYVTPQEAAELLSVNISTVHNWCRHGEVTLLQPVPRDKSVRSKYLIEIESLRLRYKRTSRSS